MKMIRRVLIILSSLIIGVIFLSGDLSAVGKNADKKKQLVLREIGKDTYLISGMKWDVNSVFIVGKKEIALIDTGNTTEEGREILRLIRKKSDKPITHIIYTHYHTDHVMGTGVIKPGFKTIAHESCKKNFDNYQRALEEYIEKTIPAKLKVLKEKQEIKDDNELKQKIKALKNEEKKIRSSKFISPDTLFKDKMTIDLGNYKIELLWPGPTHTNGSIVALIPHINTLVTGDILFNNKHPYIDSQAGSDTLNWIKYLKKAAEKKFKTIVPGHGPLCDYKTLETQAEYLELLIKKVKEAKKKGLSKAEIIKQVNMDEYKHYPNAYFVPVVVENIFNELFPEK